jgi:hypothetical protein
LLKVLIKLRWSLSSCLKSHDLQIEIIYLVFVLWIVQ